MNIDLIDDIMGFNKPKRQPIQRRQAEPEKKNEAYNKSNNNNSRSAPKAR